ncbi:hypothetical protein ABZ826_23755 [Streptomyces sp. NPDC047515]|uniref:hypothetical protein n=1 Tax=Streptomyces sp. NPDC047515 TaxID=3155380 RepID=UPI00340FCC9E
MSEAATEGAQVTLFFPNSEWSGRLPGVPRVGERLLRETPETGEEDWVVTAVEWYIHLDSEPTVSITLDPADEHTRKIVARQQAVWEARNRQRRVRPAEQ